jgi:hypothetical protein
MTGKLFFSEEIGTTQVPCPLWGGLEWGFVPHSETEKKTKTLLF